MNSNNFLWGAATSAYQIEGAYNIDGRSPSIWDTFSRIQGSVKDDSSGDIACDHYNRFKEDVAQMKNLGITSYRFSISWPRIIPSCGVINQKGLDFYRRLVEELLRADIKPMATLFHWDLPQWMQGEGGWANKQCAKYFLEYTEVIFKQLGDVVPLWITHNEPWVYGYLGHLYGDHAPGHNNKKEAVQVIHNLLVSHGRAVRLFRDMDLKGDIGISLNLSPVYAATNNSVDESAMTIQDEFLNRWFLDPLIGKGYPSRLLNEYTKQGVAPDITEGDLEMIAEPIDFLGINYYMPNRVRSSSWSDLGVEHVRKQDGVFTSLGWEVYPQGLYDLLIRMKDEYGNIPVYVTENGAAYDDVISGNMINDQERIKYLENHIGMVMHAKDTGCDVRGYYVWSLMDNFEWQHGYTARFGLLYIDYVTGKRIWKASALWYKKHIQSHLLV